jgi:hypothetical protein
LAPLLGSLPVQRLSEKITALPSVAPIVPPPPTLVTAATFFPDLLLPGNEDTRQRWLPLPFPSPIFAPVAPHTGCGGHLDDGGGLQDVFWKIDRALRVFSSRRIYRRMGDVRRWTRGPHLPPVRPRGGPRRGGVWLPSGPPPSLFWTPSRIGKNRNFGFCFVQFREYFLCNFSEI